LKIGELSRATGVSVRSIRYYEQNGLLMATRRPGGYREYTSLAIEQVNTIQLYLSLGLGTDQIADFLHCVMKNKEAFCAEVLPVYERKLAEIDGQIRQLAAIRSNLTERIAAIRAERGGEEQDEPTGID